MLVALHVRDDIPPLLTVDARFGNLHRSGGVRGRFDCRFNIDLFLNLFLDDVIGQVLGLFVFSIVFGSSEVGRLTTTDRLQIVWRAVARAAAELDRFARRRSALGFILIHRFNGMRSRRRGRAGLTGLVRCFEKVAIIAHRLRCTILLRAHRSRLIEDIVFLQRWLRWAARSGRLCRLACALLVQVRVWRYFETGYRCVGMGVVQARFSL